MQELLNSFEAGLAELGIRLAVEETTWLRAGVQQAAVQLRRGASGQDFSLVFGPAAGLADVNRVGTADRPTLLFVTYTSPRTTAALRQAGVHHLDVAGNAWIEFGDVVIDIQGRPRPQPPVGHQRRSTGNVFSAGRAQVVCALLACPQLWQASRRDVAQAAGVSVGQAHSALTLLGEVGYGPQAGPARQADLLEVWAAAFPTGLARRLTVATYAGDLDRPLQGGADQMLYVSGAAAVGDRLRPVTTLTVYVEEHEPGLAIANRWRSDGQPNIVVRRKFWRTSDHEPRTTPPLALWPLVYADLLSSEDPRVRNEAKQWKERCAGTG